MTLYFSCSDTAKFKELVRSWPYYNGAIAEAYKCVKLESGLYSEI